MASHGLELLAQFTTKRNEKHGAGRMLGKAEVDQAFELLLAFASVGVKAFAVTLTDIEGKKVPKGYYSYCSLAQLRHTLGPMMKVATAQQHNVIVRPGQSERVELIQLDDLAEPELRRLGPVSLVVLATSPGNGQSWVAVEDSTPDFARRLRQGTRADASASGATRISGSRNFKAKYAPDFPVIEILACQPGKVVRRAELERRELVALLEEVNSIPRVLSSPLTGENGRAISVVCSRRRLCGEERIAPTLARRISFGA